MKVDSDLIRLRDQQILAFEALSTYLISLSVIISKVVFFQKNIYIKKNVLSLLSELSCAKGVFNPIFCTLIQIFCYLLPTMFTHIYVELLFFLDNYIILHLVHLALDLHQHHHLKSIPNVTITIKYEINE